MCVVSMIMDHYSEEWRRKYQPPPVQPIFVPPVIIPATPLPSPQEIDEFRRLLERAREYDRKNNEPNCELEEKRRKLLDMAEQLGIKIDFV